MKLLQESSMKNIKKNPNQFQVHANYSREQKKRKKSVHFKNQIES